MAVALPNQLNPFGSASVCPYQSALRFERLWFGDGELTMMVPLTLEKVSSSSTCKYWL